MSSAWTLAHENIDKAQKRQKAAHDKRAKEPNYKVGDTVLLYSPKDKTGPTRKLALPNKGPYIITEITPTNIFVVPQGQPRATEKCVSWDRIHSCPQEMQNKEEATPTQSVPMATEGWKERLRPRGRQTRKSSNEDVSSGERGGRCNSMT